ncbi:hypothetical protein [Priestia megaterium]|uniref:hypothetical protein n=1 Tax=Priestia megaterium TaxID=1404 RepID=UPI001BE89515|nr:hypothetical protein [Priestia megaterium]MBT2259806.1 hypothetical protein [Priestia megaterium]
MKFKDCLLSIMLNVFLGYLWIFLIHIIFDLVKFKEHAAFLGVTLTILGTLLFGEVIRRTNPFIKYKVNHPVKVAGFIAFGLVVVFNLYCINF